MWWDAWSLRECKLVDPCNPRGTLHDGVVAFIYNLGRGLGERVIARRAGVGGSVVSEDMG